MNVQIMYKIQKNEKYVPGHVEYHNELVEGMQAVILNEIPIEEDGHLNVEKVKD